MKNLLISSVAAVAVLAFVGCAPKKSCGTTPVAVKAPAPVAKVAPVAKPAPVPAPAPAPVVVEEVEAVVVPAVDAKEAAVQ